jgi:hypothetical protein
MQWFPQFLFSDQEKLAPGGQNHAHVFFLNLSQMEMEKVDQAMFFLTSTFLFLFPFYIEN